MKTFEKSTTVLPGWPMLAFFVVTGPLLIWALIYGINDAQSVRLTIFFILSLAVWVVCTFLGFFALQPNQAAVLILFGKYKGTVKSKGFCWANPLLIKKKVSLRARNLNGEIIKVNDLRGNPIEIGAVIVWKVEETAHAVFDVDDYAHFVSVQSESALRHLAMAYPYDDFEGDSMSLRGSTDEVSTTLQKEVQERVEKAGVKIEEARLSHLAYAQEIASVMLQRQQADAIVAARTRIVDGAVGMAEMALKRLEDEKMFELDDERKASMVSNLLVVLCAHESPTPVVNTGTLYT